MKKNLLTLTLLVSFSVSALALDKSNLIEKSEKLFDCSELVDQKMMEKLENINKELSSNSTLLKLVEKENKKQKLTKKEEQELLKIQLHFYKSSQDIHTSFVENSIECLKQSFPKFPDLELNKE